MPINTTPAGLQVRVPGVYSAFEVVSDLPGALPAFQIPFILADADEGIPFDVRDKQYTHESFNPWQNMGTSSATRAFYGADSDLAQAMAWAKLHGLPRAYCVAMNDMIRANVLVTSAGPINQFYLAAKKWGAPGGHQLIKFAAGVWEITPLKHFSRLTTNTSAPGTRIYVRDNSWIVAGMTLYIGDNDTADVAKVVDSVGTELDSKGQVAYWVELTSGVGAVLATTKYAMVLQYDDAKKEVSGTFTTGQACVDWLQVSEYVTASKHANFSNALPIAIAVATPLKEIAAWGAIVDGTSPASISTDYDDFIADMDEGGWERFAQNEQVYPRAFLVVNASSTIQKAMRTWAVAKRTEGFAISITAGTDWGDTVLSASNDTNPGYRAAALDNQDFMLCAGGLDKVASYLSLAPAIFGLRVGKGLPHNLTQDGLIYSEVEYEWDERNSGELTTLHTKGVVTYRLSYSTPIKYVVSEGLSTLQDNANSWNVDSATTCLVMQRDLADFVDRTIREDLDGTQLGGDEVDAASIAAVILKRGRDLKKRGYLIADLAIISLSKSDSGAGWDLNYRAQLPTTCDFINATCTIYIAA